MTLVPGPNNTVNEEESSYSPVHSEVSTAGAPTSSRGQKRRLTEDVDHSVHEKKARRNTVTSNSAKDVPQVLRNFVNNNLTASKSRTWSKVHDPCTQRLLCSVPESSIQEVQSAVHAAENALPGWAILPVSKRKALLHTLVHTLRLRADEFLEILRTEVGKTLRDSEAELERGIDAIQTACAATSEMHGRHWSNPGTDTYTVIEPIGVCLSITPFNFPLMIPLWSIPFALIAGNTVILKPSEKTPSVANLLGEAFAQSGFPPGVLNIVYGTSEAVQKLLSQPAISAVSFVGSEIIGEQVYDHAKATRKRVQIESSGKNHGVIMEDASKQQSLYAIAGSAFGAAGQRCMALSVLICVGSTSDWIPDLVNITQSLKVGSGQNNDIEIGPLITSDARKRVEKIIDDAEAEGAEVKLDGRNYKVPDYPKGNFVGPTIITNVQPHMQCYQEEIFGPVLICIEVETLDEATTIINENRYGNGCTIFTTSPVHARAFETQVNVGQIGVNVPVLSPSGNVARTSNKDSYLGDGMPDRQQWKFFTSVKTVTTLWR